MKKGLKKLIIGGTTIAALSIPVITSVSGNNNGQEAKALNGFYTKLGDDCCDDDRYDFDDHWDNDWDDKYDFDDRWDNDWDDDRYDFDDYLDDHYDRWDD